MGSSEGMDLENFKLLPLVFTRAGIFKVLGYF